MEKKITLRKPIEINGRKVTELTYDAEEITNDMFLQACAQSAELSKTKTISLKVRENDYALHLYLGIYGDYRCESGYRYHGLTENKRGRYLTNCGYRSAFYFAEVGGNLRGKQLRRAIREYSRAFFTSVRELGQQRLIDFLRDYGEAVEEEKEREKARDRDLTSKKVRPKKLRKPR